jgi:AcrR family transcriptional regulator
MSTHIRQAGKLSGAPRARKAAVAKDDSPATPVSPKRQAIEVAAARVFLRDGYAGASVDVIAREAGVSKATLYSHFRSKEVLFGAIICQQCGHMVAEAQTSGAAGASPEQILRRLGERFLDNTLSPNLLAFYRVVAGEAYRFPALGKVIYESGPGPARVALANYLRDLTKEGRLAVKHPEMAADQFLGSLLGGIHFRQILQIEERPSKRMIEAWVENAVTAFLAAYTPR